MLLNELTGLCVRSLAVRRVFHTLACVSETSVLVPIPAFSAGGRVVLSQTKLLHFFFNSVNLLDYLYILKQKDI